MPRPVSDPANQPWSQKTPHKSPPACSATSKKASFVSLKQAAMGSQSTLQPSFLGKPYITAPTKRTENTNVSSGPAWHRPSRPGHSLPPQVSGSHAKLGEGAYRRPPCWLLCGCSVFCVTWQPLISDPTGEQPQVIQHLPERPALFPVE